MPRRPGRRVGRKLRVRREAASRLADRAVHEAARERRRVEEADAPGARRFAEHGDVAGVATECRDVVANPSKRGDLIEDAVVAGCAVVRIRGQFLVREEAHHAEAVVDADQHHALLGERAAVVHGQVPVADLQCAAVNPHHHRDRIARGGPRPDVEV